MARERVSVDSVCTSKLGGDFLINEKIHLNYQIYFFWFDEDTLFTTRTHLDFFCVRIRMYIFIFMKKRALKLLFRNK